MVLAFGFTAGLATFGTGGTAGIANAAVKGVSNFGTGAGGLYGTRAEEDARPAGGEPNAFGGGEPNKHVKYSELNPVLVFGNTTRKESMEGAMLGNGNMQSKGKCL